MKKKLILSLMVLGLSGIIAEVLLLRELLIIFYGNELTIGIILANWLILEAIGAYLLGKNIEHILRKLEGFVGLEVIFSLSFPWAIYLTRIIRDVFGIVPGVGLGLGPVFLFSFLVLFPVSVSHGALFTFGCRIFSLHVQPEAKGIGRVYVYETIGTILGGLIFTYFLIPYLHSFQIAFSITLINFLLCVLLLGKFWDKGRTLTSKTLGLVVAILCFINIILFTGEVEKIHRYSIRRQWKEYEVKYYQNTFFGNIVVAEKENALTFFFNGLPLVDLSSPDVYSVEEFAHFSLLSHEAPRDVLVIGKGAGGLINELLKHSVKSIDYVEIDPLFLKALKKFSNSLIAEELNNPRVNIISLDGRFFIKRTDKKYDLILVGIINPWDLQSNRYFTQEFFSLAKRSLKDKGILAFRLPSLPRAILNLKELRELNGSILFALEKVYRCTRVIPGDGNNLFLASTSKEITLIDSKLFIERMKDRRIATSLLIPPYVEYRLEPWWYNNFFNSLKDAPLNLNKDFKPIATFYSLAYWNALFSPYLLGISRGIDKTILFTGIFLLCSFVVVLLSRRIRLSIPYSVLTTGFSGMLFNLVLIFVFQIVYGYVFHWIGFLITSFMGGVAFGGFLMTENLEKIKRDRFWFLNTELSLILFSIILPFIFFIIHNFSNNPFVFLLTAFLAGIFIGVQFPLANKIYLNNCPDLSKTAGLLYGADLVGGWFAGICGGILILPLLGVYGTFMVIFILKLASFTIFFFSRRF
ncbi:MAG: spermine synthase [Candidatus Omnitrophica bacterium]|nr:spermine synthase [Candidatus Omnitrophota bacterium]